MIKYNNISISESMAEEEFSRMLGVALENKEAEPTLIQQTYETIDYKNFRLYAAVTGSIWQKALGSGCKRPQSPNLFSFTIALQSSTNCFNEFSIQMRKEMRLQVQLPQSVAVYLMSKERCSRQ